MVSEENVRIRRFMTKRTVYKRMLVFEGLSVVFAIMHTDRVSFADLSSETTVFFFFFTSSIVSLESIQALRRLC